MPPKYYAIEPKVLATPKGDFRIGIEKMSDVREEIAPLHREHWDEVEKGFTDLTMDVAYDKYAAFEERGQFILFTVRDPVLALVGYFMCYMHRANHAQNDLVAREDAFFITKPCRGWGIANHLMKFIKAALKGFGCKTLSVSSRHFAGGTDLTHWLARHKFKPSALVLVAEL